MHNGRGDAQKSAKYSEQEPIADQELTDATCTKCGAWRGELGLEPTFHMYIKHLVRIFDEVKRVLKPTGTCFVNLGDTYASSSKGSGGSGELGYGDGVYARLKKRAGFSPPHKFELGTVKEKSLCMIPERFAMAMIDRQWILRNKIVWAKPNVMPSSIKDRFTVSHEYVYFFTKSPKKYYFDTQYEPYKSDKSELARHPTGQSSFGGHNKYAGYDNGTYSDKVWEPQIEVGRITLDVWSISTQPYGEAHFATYPEKLCETPIKAGCPPVNGTVIDPFCGSGTTGLVALKLARDFIGIDVSSEYLELAKKRLEPYLNQERLA
jgi:site-specific DNA-methyltransferase (adenine-specific)